MNKFPNKALQLFISFQFKDTVIPNIKRYVLTFENYDLQSAFLVFSHPQSENKMTMDLKVAQLRPTHIQQMIFIWRGKLKAVLPKVKISTGSHGYVNGECLADQCK